MKETKIINWLKSVAIQGKNEEIGSIISEAIDGNIYICAKTGTNEYSLYSENDFIPICSYTSK